MIEAIMAFIAERAKFTSKSSNVNAVAKFYTTLDDAQILLVANNCNNYFYNDYNNAGIFGAKSLTNNNYETYIGTMKSKTINKIASFTNNNISLNTQTTIAGNILPASNISYDLGSSNFKWRDLYLSGNTIYLGDTLISTDTSNGTLLITDKNKKIVDINNLSATITSTSNTISSRITTLDSNMSNYINTKAFGGSSSSIAVSSQWKYENSNIYYNEGWVGIGNTFATETLDVTGNIKFSGNINGISYTELSQLSGISNNIETQLQDINSYINTTSNILDDKINNLSILNDAELRWGANPGYVYYSNVQVHPTEIRVYNPNTTILNTYAYYVFENQNLLLVDSGPNARSLLDTGALNAQYAYDNGRNSISLQTNSCVRLPYNNWNFFSDLTISGWFKTYASKNGDKFINFDNSIPSTYQKFPKQNLTGFTHVYTDGTGRTLRVAESSRYSSEFGWYLFSTAIFWTTNGGYSAGTSTQTSKYFANDSSFYGEWVMIDLGEYIYFDKYRIFPNSELYRAPRDFRIYATNDNNAWNNNRSTSWVQIDERLDITSWVNGGFIEFTPTILNTQLAYRYFAIIINKKNNTTDAYVRFNQWEIYGRNVPKSNNIKLINNNSNLSFQINDNIIYETPIVDEEWNYVLWNVSSSSNQEYININNSSNIYYNSSLNRVKYPREAITYDSLPYVYQDGTIVNVTGTTRFNSTSNSWYNVFNSNINDEGWISSSLISSSLNGLAWTQWLNGYYVFSGTVYATGIDTNINNRFTTGGNFGVEYTGFFYTQGFSGIFTFNINSDDGSQLWLTINGIETSIVAFNSGSRSGTITLNAYTFYPIKIRFGQGGGACYLTVSFAPPGQSLRTDGTGFYYINSRSDYRGDYIITDLGESAIINNYILYANSNNLIRAPKNFRLYASTNSSAYTNINHSSWTLLDDETVSETYYQRSINFNNVNAYRYYSLIVNSTFDSANSNLVQLAELELYGYPQLSYLNALGDTSNLGSISISDLKILTTELTPEIQTELYNPIQTYIKLADENYVNNIFSNIAESKWLSSVNDIYYTSGNVGIGGPAYGYKLNVNGTLNVVNDITTNGDLYAKNIYMNSNIVSTHWTQINNDVYYNLIGNVGIGTSTILSKLHIAESVGTAASANTASIIIDHANSGGASSITFRSSIARGSDYGYIQYQDSTTVGAGGESAKLILGTQNDADDDLILLPSGNVGIGTTLVQSKLTINAYVTENNNFNHNEAPLTITNQTVTSTTVLNDPRSVLHLCRQGTASQAFGSKASFKLCRWENLATHSRTRMDITLTNQSYDDINVLSIRSDGRLGIGTTNPSTALQVVGDISCTNVIASNLTGSINTDNIKSGILSIVYGGTGVEQFNTQSLLVGNNINGIYQPINLVWDNAKNSLGIGTSTPEGIVTICGNTNTSNNIATIPSIIFSSNDITGIDIQKKINTYNIQLLSPIVWYQFNENPLTSNILIDYNTNATKYNLNVETNYNDQFITSYALTLWYKFNGNDTDMLLDSSGSNFNAINSGNATFDSNVFITGNGSVYLNGSSQYIDISSNINPYTIQISNGISFSVWFKMSITSPSSSRILDISSGNEGTNPSNYILIYRNAANTSILFNINGSAYTTPTLVDNTWHHIVWTISSTGVWNIYIDNVYYFPNVTRTIPNVTWTRRYIGRSAFAADGYYIGNIDDFRIINRVLTAAEVSALYNVNNYINNPVLWYKFNENSTNMLLDSSGNYFTAYNSGSATFDNDVNDYRTGDGSIYFDGNNKYIDINSNINISTLSANNGLTFTTWFKVPIASVTGSVLFSFGDGTIGANPTNFVSVSRNSTNSNLVFNINNITFTSSATTAYIDNNFHHLSWSISRLGEWIVYLDNQYVYPNLASARAIPSATWTKRYIGRAPGATNAYLTGNIDDFRIYNRVLTSNEVSDIYNQNNINILKRTAEEYPPIALNSLTGTTTNVSQTISGHLYGNGVYNISASSVTSGINLAFNKLIANANDQCWLSAANYNVTTGLYASSVSTIYNNTLTYAGEWIQIQLPYNVILSSYLLVSQVNSGLSTISQRAPKDFILLGSTNGINWFLLDTEVNITNWGFTGIPKIFTVANNTTAYSYYRLCINKTQGGGTYANYAGITEWELFGNQPSTLNALIKNIGYTINTQSSKDAYQYQNAFTWNHDTSWPYDNSYLSYDNTANIQSMLNTFHTNQAFTIHYVFKTSKTSQTSHIFYIGNTSVGDLVRSYINGNDSKLYFNIGSTQCSTFIVSNRYYVVDLVFTPTNLNIYLNGTIANSVVYSYNNILSNVSTSGLVYYIGKYTENDINDATPIVLQDFRIFASALSASAISSLQIGDTQYLDFTSSKTENFGIERWISSSGYYSDSDKYISYSDGNVGIGTNNPTERLDIIGNIKVTGNILPASNISYDIGSSNFKWRDLYLSGNTIYLGDTLISTDTETGALLVTDKNKNILDVNNFSLSIAATSNYLQQIQNMNPWYVENSYIKYSNIQVYTDEIKIYNPYGNTTFPYINYDFSVDPTLTFPTTTLINQGSAGNAMSASIYNVNTSVLTSTYPFDTTTDLICWYKFDNNFGDIILDTSGNTRTLTNYNNNVSFDNSDYKRGNGSVIFGNNGAYFQIVNSSHFASDNFTICCWCKISSLSGNTIQYLASFMQETPFYGWDISVVNNNLQFRTGNGTSTLSGLNESLINNFADNTWKHLVITLNKELQQTKIYLNGVLITSVTRVYQNTNISTNFYIGRGYSQENYLRNSSRLDDFRMYNRVLSINEIKQVMGYTLTRQSGRTANSYAYYWNGLSTDIGDNAYILLPKTSVDPIVAKNAFTVSAWIKNETLDNQCPFFTLAKNTNAYYVDILQTIENNTTSSKLSFSNGNITTIYNTTWNNVNTVGEWAHYAYTFKYIQNKVYVKLYKNGILQTPVTGGGEFTINNFTFQETENSSYAVIANNISNANDLSPAYIEDFKLYDEELTETQVRVLAELDVPVPTFKKLIDDIYFQSILDTSLNNTTSYIRDTSNILQTQLNDISLDWNNITNKPATIQNIDQELINTSNQLTTQIEDIEVYASVLTNTMLLQLNETDAKQNYTSNLLQTQINNISSLIGSSMVTNMSNYLNTTSNTLANSLVGTSNVLSNRITNLSADQIADGITNKFIISNTYNNDLMVKGKLTACNLDIIGETTTIKTSTYQTENLEIVTQATDGPAFKIIQNGSQNLVDMYDTNSNVFTVTKAGRVGIANTNPSEKLDIVGNIKFTGNINNVTSTQLDYVNGVTSSIQTQINNTNTYTSNYINITSNQFANAIISTSNNVVNTSNTISSRVTILDLNISNYVTRSSNQFANAIISTSNDVVNTSNTISSRVTFLDLNISNYVTRSSNQFANAIISTSNNVVNTSNTISSRVTILDLNISNYVIRSSNQFANAIISTSNDVVNTSNTISSRVTILDLNISNYVTRSSNQFANAIISTSNNVVNTSNTISSRVTFLDLNISNYVTRTSNQFANAIISTSNDVVNTSNVISMRLTTFNTTVTNLDLNMSNYLNTTSNQLAKDVISLNTATNNKINNITSDQITIGTSNRFIVNHRYKNDLYIDGAIYASNLYIYGSNTIIQTDTYTTENMQIVSQTNDGPALMITQNGDDDIVEFYDTNSNVFIIKKGGNVGITNANPQEKLDIIGNIKFTGSINNVTSTQLGYVNGVTSSIQTQLNAKEPSITTLAVTKGGTGKSTITASRLLGCITANTVDEITLGSNLSFSGNTLNATGGSGSSQWTTSGTMIYYNSGNVGIGVTNPGQNLEVNGTIKSTSLELPTTSATSVYWTATTSALGRAFNNGQYSSSAVSGDIILRSSNNLHLQSGTGASAITIDTNNNVGIGKTNPSTSYKLDVTGNVFVTGSILATGNITASYSDIRLKEIINCIENPLDKVMKINTFKYKPSALAHSLNIHDNIQVGVSAQDVKEVLPEVVSLAAFDTSNLPSGEVISKSGSEYLTVSYERLVPLLIECIKELNHKVDFLLQNSR